jgi:hypothetical protein
MRERGTQPRGQRFEFILGRQQLAAKIGQLGYLPGEHRLDEAQPGGEMPVQRPAGHPGPPGDLVQGGAHAELGERGTRLLDQLPVVTPGVRPHWAPGGRPRTVTCQRNHHAQHRRADRPQRQIARLRDYVNIPAATAAMGHDL